MSCVLITGGGGFLAEHLCAALLKKNYEVRTFDIVSHDRSNSQEHIVGDIRDRGTLKKALRGVQAVVHAAAALPLSSAKEIFSVNVDGTRAVLELALRLHIPRVIFISTTAVYGVPKRVPILETDRRFGVGPYGQSKIEAENIVYEYRQKGMIIPILRPKTFIGPGRLGVFQILFDWIEKGARIPMIGNGSNRYQLLDVLDLTDVILMALEGSENITNDDFNVGANRFKTVREDLGSLLLEAGTASKLLPMPAWSTKLSLRVLEAMRLSPLYTWIYETADKDSFVSTEKIERAFSWQPKFSNAESLVRTFQWYRSQKSTLAFRYGISHRSAWKQGALSVARKILGG